jgi:putative transposase
MIPSSQCSVLNVFYYNARLRDEFLNGEIFHTLKEAKILIEQWRIHYNTVRPHSALNWKPPAPESLFQLDQGIMIN